MDETWDISIFEAGLNVYKKYCSLKCRVVVQNRDRSKKLVIIILVLLY